MLECLSNPMANLVKCDNSNRQAMGLHHAVALCMDHCHDAELTPDNTWYKTVVLAGGTACLPGLAGLKHSV